MAWRAEGPLAHRDPTQEPRSWQPSTSHPAHTHPHCRTWWHAESWTTWVARHTHLSCHEASPNVRLAHPRPCRRLRRCPGRSQDARYVVPRVTMSEDAPLVHSCVQDTAQDSVRVDVTPTSGRRRRLRALTWSWDRPSEVAVSSNVPPEVLDAMELGNGPT